MGFDLPAGAPFTYFLEMTMRSLFLPLLVLWMTVNVSLGVMVSEDSEIEEVNKAMTAAGYSESGLDMAPADPKHDMAFWAVDGGVLIVLYSTETKKVTGVTYWLCDERPKGTRKTFEMTVKCFDTDSGLMIVQTKARK